jgi:apolipoprotein N-acyltransferase
MRLIELSWRLPLAALSGLVSLYTFPTESVWLLAPLIPALLLVSVAGVSFWWAGALGFIAGMAFYISHIEWIALYLGPVPLIALAVLQSLFSIPAAGLMAVVWRKLEKGSWVLVSVPLASASIWTAREWVTTNFPYGGFPWSRLSMTQAESPMVNTVGYLGMSGLSLFVALVGGIIATLWLRRKQVHSRSVLVGGLAALAIVLVPSLLPVGTTERVGTLTLLAVQGNANAGLFSNLERGRILQNHLDATVAAMDANAAAENVQLIVWPENASDLDPLRHPEAARALESLVARYQTPITFGTITNRSDKLYNTTMLWTPEQGLVDYYDKKRPVPFAEYVPDRAFWRGLAPDLIDLIPRSYEFGTRDGIFELAQGDVGTLICFEIAVDSISRDLVADGATLILSQTNNADFGYSDETFQQVAIAKLRAIETGRTVVNISTVGQSAIYAPDGREISSLEWYKPGAMLETLELRSGVTLAMILGPALDPINGLFVGGLAFWTFFTRRESKLRGSKTKRRRTQR